MADRPDDSPRDPNEPHPEARAGLLYALGAYLAWGVVAVYFKLLKDVHPMELLCHRVVWSVLFLGLVVTAQRHWGEVRAALTAGRAVLALLGSTVMIALNWYVFIHAIDTDQLALASLGYFLNPLVNVLLGVAVLGERLRPVQIAALALAGVAVGVQAWGVGGVPWIALSLALTFGLYALLRKTMRVGPLVGLTVETLLLAPAAIVYLLVVLPGVSRSAWPDGRTMGLLMAAGVVTAVPLLLFAAGARRVRLSTMGVLQYVSPTCQFLLAVLVYHEPLTRARTVSFALIWVGLILFTVDSLLHVRREQRERARRGFEVTVLET